jgi:hypothetical protein
VLEHLLPQVVVAAPQAGWFTLMGVALGAGLTAGSTLLLERLRRKRDAAMARRLVSDDLERVDRALTTTEENLRRAGQPLPKNPGDNQQWPLGWERVTWAQSWAGYREILASNMNDEQFSPLATAFGFIEQFQHSLAASRRPFVEPDDRDFLADVRAETDKARESMR